MRVREVAHPAPHLVALAVVLVACGAPADPRDADPGHATPDDQTAPPPAPPDDPAVQDRTDTSPAGGTATTGSTGASPLSLCTVGDTRAVPLLGEVACIPPGTFVAGCVQGRDDLEGICFQDELPAHEVTLTRPYWMMTEEVTFGQYIEVTGHTPEHDDRADERPVEGITWAEAVAFADAVSRSQGLTPCRGADPYACDGWRLPTQAEWEHAARGGNEHRFAGGDDAERVAHYWSDTECRDGAGTCGTHPGCLKDRNGYGLCDMSGNVWEWTHDWYGPYASSPRVDPTGPTSGPEHVFRGGYWNCWNRGVRVVSRMRHVDRLRGGGIGFRLVRSMP